MVAHKRRRRSHRTVELLINIQRPSEVWRWRESTSGAGLVWAYDWGSRNGRWWDCLHSRLPRQNMKAVSKTSNPACTLHDYRKFQMKLKTEDRPSPLIQGPTPPRDSWSNCRCAGGVGRKSSPTMMMNTSVISWMTTFWALRDLPGSELVESVERADRTSSALAAPPCPRQHVFKLEIWRASTGYCLSCVCGCFECRHSERGWLLPFECSGSLRSMHRCFEVGERRHHRKPVLSASGRDSMFLRLIPNGFRYSRLYTRRTASLIVEKSAQRRDGGLWCARTVS